jgi:L-malate glycosyltransferase
MKVLVISHSCVVDVNQQVFVALSRIPGLDVGLLAPANWKSEYTGQTMALTRLPEATFPMFPSPVLSPGHVSLHCYKQLPLKELRGFAPDVILSTQEPWSLSGLQAMYLSATLKAPLVFQTNQNILKRLPAPFSWIEAETYRRAAMAFAYSEEARQVLIRKGFRKPTAVVPYATDTRLFYRREVGSLSKRLGLEDAVVVGYLGRLVPEKGLDTLVEAMAALYRRGNLPVRVMALIVGSGSAEDALKQQVDTVGLGDRFVFTGSVPHSEAPDYMSCLDIFVLPSRTTPTWKEQFGRVIIEALSCGVPVIGSDSGQIPNLIRETGGGLVFPEGDAVKLADALERLVRNPAEKTRLAAAGARVVKEQFTCEAVARQMGELLAETRASTAKPTVADVNGGGS